MERGICLIAVLYVAINVLSLTLRTIVGQQGYTFSLPQRLGVPQWQPHRCSVLATLPSVGAVP